MLKAPGDLAVKALCTDKANNEIITREASHTAYAVSIDDEDDVDNDCGDDDDDNDDDDDDDDITYYRVE